MKKQLKYKQGEVVVINNNKNGDHCFKQGTFVLIYEIIQGKGEGYYIAHNIFNEADAWAIGDENIKGRLSEVYHINNRAMPATLLCDFYKISHRVLYPEGTEYIYSTLVPRNNKYLPVADGVVVFQIQAFIKEYLIEYFNKNFFNRGLFDVVCEYARVIQHTLGGVVDVSHIIALHKLGYLPIRIEAVPEGTLVPFNTPVLTIENTHPDFFWLTNYLETLISMELWKPMTSATIARQYRLLLDKYAIETTGSTEGVDFQAHDFSMRGMDGLYPAAASAAAHLLFHRGTDTIAGIWHLEKYYNADVKEELVGTSIPATEHSVMSALTPASSDRDEEKAVEYIITKGYPEGLVSIVFDTYDFWRNVTEVLPNLKDKIMARNGKVVIRPDSGDPVDILCGTYEPKPTHMAQKFAKSFEEFGLIECLWNIFGGTINEQGYKVLDPHIGAIYGDSITLERAEQILEKLKLKGFASTNIVFGIGSFTYQYNTRDTLGFAIKATNAVINGVEVPLLKDPKTDSKKKSHSGRVAVIRNLTDNKISVIDRQPAGLKPTRSILQTVFEDGKLLIDVTLNEIRETVKKDLK